ncbi:MAG: hypothetical protein ACJ76H_03435 [Bacteriovoracaceae bacterium]
MKTFIVVTLALMSVSAFADITLSRDSRPVDGPLVELKIKNENSRHSATVTLRTVIVSRMSSEQQESKEVLGVSMDCDVKKAGGKIKSVYCVDDRRPVDGPKTEVIVEDTRIGYQVTQKVTIVSRMSGQESTTSKVVAVGLK